MSRAHRRRLRHDYRYALPRRINGHLIYCTNSTFREIMRQFKHPQPLQVRLGEDGRVILSANLAVVHWGIPIRSTSVGA